MLPLYEGKMAHHYDHRWATFDEANVEDPRALTMDEKADSSFVSQPRYWVPEFDVPTGEFDRKGRATFHKGVASRLAEMNWNREWLLGWRDVCRATDERTAIAGFVPLAGVGHKYPLMFLPDTEDAADKAAGLVACMSSFVFDFVSRQKIGSTSMGVFIWKQLPVPSWAALEPHMPFLKPRVAELACTASDMGGLAADLGFDGPASWDEDRRAALRAEIDAYMFILYGIDRDDVDYIMDSFQTDTGGLRNNEIAKYGRYRSKELILEAFDQLSAAGLTVDNPVDVLER
jgi:hypothetical protein